MFGSVLVKGGRSCGLVPVFGFVVGPVGGGVGIGMAGSAVAIMLADISERICPLLPQSSIISNVRKVS